MTTPRVTVPVEPEFTHYRRSQIAHLRPYVSGETLSDRVSISAADLEAGSPKPGDMIARNPDNHDDQWLVAADYFAANFEPISAAPAPEGGVVSRDQVLAIVRQFASPSWCSVDRLVDTLCAALATREEAPAKAGERERLIQDLSDAESWRRLPGNENHLATADLFARAISALRAQPPAREDARPVAWPEELTPEMENVWRSAFISQGHLRRNADGRVKHPDSCERAAYRALRRFVAKNHPAPDALRAAVEALEPFARAADKLDGHWSEDDWRWNDSIRSGVTVRDIRRARQALAALQAEQGAK